MACEKLQIVIVLQMIIYAINQRMLNMKLESRIFQESGESVKTVCHSEMPRIVQISDAYDGGPQSFIFCLLLFFH